MKKEPGIIVNGPVLRDLVKTSGRTAASVAKEVGVSGATWTNWVKGERLVSPDNLEAIVKAFNLADDRSLRIDTIESVRAEAERRRALRNKPVAA